MNYNDLLVKFVETKKSVTALEAIMLNDFVTFLALEAAQHRVQADDCPDSPTKHHYFDDEKGVCLYCGIPPLIKKR